MKYLMLSLIVAGLIGIRTSAYTFEVHGLSMDNQIVETSKKVTAVVTAYSKDETCPDNPCITSSGKIATKGLVACPRVYKHGTAVEIKGVRYVCADRTHKRFDGRFDIFMGYDEAIKWGKQNLEVSILK